MRGLQERFRAVASGWMVLELCVVNSTAPACQESGAVAGAKSIASRAPDSTWGSVLQAPSEARSGSLPTLHLSVPVVMF